MITKRSMPWILLVVAALLVGGGALLLRQLLPPAAAPATADPAQARKAEAFLDLLDAGRYDEALAMGTPRLRDALADGKLQKVWETLPRQLGERRARGPIRGETVDGQPILTASLQFGLTALDARIAFDADGLIGGFRLVPAQTSATPAAPVSTERYAETAVVVGSPDGDLPGLLTLPVSDGRVPGVVLVHGSGPHDRDETIGPNKPFRDLAHDLAERGVAVLRYDKRTQVAPQRFSGGDFTVEEEVIADALAAVAVLRARPEIDPARIFVVGHSLGAMLAPRIAERDPRIAGLVLLAAPAIHLEDAVMRQSRYLASLDGTPDGETEAALAALEHQRDRIKRLAAEPDDAAPLMLNLPRRYWLDLNGYDAIASARRIGQPLLIAQGDADYQVTPEDDFARWREAFGEDGRARLILYPGLSHLFMPAGDRPGPADYAKAGHVADALIADVADWIATVGPAP
jgi:uncharacterized protein